MLVPVRWLKDHVAFDLTPQELCEFLTNSAGLETNVVKNLHGAFGNVVIGRVEEKKSHPNADKLSLCRVIADRGDQWIVCGAPNVAPGQTVVVAQIGARLANGMKIEQRKIRGVSSDGMICSEQELGISDESAGIIILSETEAAPGDRFSDRFPVEDVVLDVDVTPNRGDCLSVIGVARELAVAIGGTLKTPEPVLPECDPPISDLVSVELRNADLCPRYSARVIEKVAIGPSPFWLRLRLSLSGLRPIGNVVDVTNYLMWEWGQPLHAFDLEQLAGKKIVIRNAGADEPFTTLDGKTHALKPDMLVIADGERPVALAGIMGGLHSGVTPATSRILLECAHFNPSSVRATSKRLGIQSESSYRFERGTDWENLIHVSDRAAGLIASLSGGSVARGRIDAYPKPLERPAIRLRPNRVHQVLGVSIPAARMEEILTRLQFRIKTGAGDMMEVEPPTFRHDITREIDLVEEIARHHGCRNIPSALPRIQAKSSRIPKLRDAEHRVHRFLRSAGFSETINYSFLGPQFPETLRLPEAHPLRQAVPLKNPLSQDWAVMRTSLLPGLLSNVALNSNRFVYDLKLFEIGTVFFRAPDGGEKENRMAAAAVTETVTDSLWVPKGAKRDFYFLKGVAEGMLSEFGIPFTSSTPEEADPSRKNAKRKGEPARIPEAVFIPDSDLSFFQPGRGLTARIQGVPCCSLGTVRKEILDAFGIRMPVFYMEMDLQALASFIRFEKKYQPLPRFPGLRRDLALVLDRNVPSGDIIALVRDIGPASLVGVELFDLYQGKPLPENKKSVGIKLMFQDRERTLTDEEVNRIFEKILKYLQERIGASLRES